jgi:hypothetical protein
MPFHDVSLKLCVCSGLAAKPLRHALQGPLALLAATAERIICGSGKRRNCGCLI